MFRVLKPGGIFGVYEWVMTDEYNSSDDRHQAVRLGIERGNGISNMVPRKEALQAMQKAGFIVEYEEDIAKRTDRKPWYAPLDGDLGSSHNLTDFLGYLRMSKLGRIVIGCILRSMEALRLAPSGTAETAAELSDGADALVAGGKENLFTPMYLMIVRKPLI